MLNQEHTGECLAANGDLLKESDAFFSKWRSACRWCNATGHVKLSGLDLPCASCLGSVSGQGPFCPRCGSKSIYPETKLAINNHQGYWPSGKPCLKCGWANARDGAPIFECSCPVAAADYSQREKVSPITPAAAKESKEARLEKMRKEG